MSHPEDRILIQRLLNQDEQALRELYRTYSPLLSRYLSRQISESDRAEELVQDVFLDFLEGLRSFRGDSSIKTYLYSIARHKIIDHIRRRKIRKILFSRLPATFVDGLQAILIDDEIDRADLAEQIEQALGLLPNDYQLILRLKYIEGRRMKDIATRLSMNFKAAESLLYRARRAFIQSYEHIET